MSKPDKVIPEKCLDYPMEDTKTQITSRDGILYALGVGYSEDPLNEQDLKYTYELNEDFKICPTFGIFEDNQVPAVQI